MKLTKLSFEIFKHAFLIVILNVLYASALYKEKFNQFLDQYDTIKYEPSQLNYKHNRVQRSLDTYLYFSFKGHGRNFKFKLHPSIKNSFDNHKIELPTKKQHVNKLVDFYEGILLDEPFNSHVSGTIIDGIFYGTIESDRHGKYYVESARRYNHTLDAHSIIYHENDINLDATHGKTKRSVNNDENYLKCGASKKDVEGWLKEEQKKLYDERQATKGFDPFSYLDPDRYHLFDNVEHEFNKYSRDAQSTLHHTNKRAAIKDKGTKKSPKRIKFPDQRTMCDLYLRVDPQLYTEIFNNEGNEDHVKTVSFILFYLNKHVEALNSIYNGLKFYDADKSRYYVGVQFMIYRTKIITEEQCRTKANLTKEELKLCVPFLDVSAFLNYVSLDNFDDYCLSYTFTARDFTDGTLGLAWVAKLTGSVGGVCERRQTLQGIAKSLNSGIVTVVNYKSRVPEAVSQITFAHEVGHNFGSEHDPDDTLCSPGMNKGGNYIMYRRATTGTDRNNRNFSQCSKDQMGPVIHSLIQNPTKFCFKQYNGSLCGNGIVEPGEECDCGYANECKEQNCCYDADQKPSEKCRLKPNAKCSPSQGPCCNKMCEYAPSTTVCMLNNECLNNVTCTGKNAFCPRNSSAFFKSSLTPCNSGTQVCRDGECVGSICEAHDMVQCYLQGDLKDKQQDKSILCHLACIGEKTGNICMDSFQIKDMGTATNTSGLILKPGSPCIGTLGYCDIFSKCRPVDGEGPLLRLKNLLLNPVTLSAIREWVTRYWWAVMLMTVGVLVFMVAFIKVCSVHTPSSNPRKPPALKITDTLRRPIKHIPHPHLHRSTPSAPPAPSNGRTSSSNNKQHVVNERYSKNQKINAKSSRQSTQSNGQVATRQSSSNRHASKSKTPSSSKPGSSNGHVSSNPNHITDKSQRASKLNNVFTLKKRHKSSEPIAMQRVSSKSSNPNRAKSSKNESNKTNRSKSVDTKHHIQGNRNVENLPPRPEMVIKNVKRASKLSKTSTNA